MTGQSIHHFTASIDADNIIPLSRYRRWKPPLTLNQRCRAWRAVRCPRGSYRTPLPEDLRHD